MKTIQLHPTSLFVGAAVVGLAFLTMAQNPQPINPNWSPRNPLPVVLLRDYIQIREGTPYTVPPNKILMVTALGSGSNTGQAWIYVSGRSTAEVTANCNASSSVLELARGLTLNAGDIVGVFGANTGGSGVAWGFLADA